MRCVRLSLKPWPQPCVRRLFDIDIRQVGKLGNRQRSAAAAATVEVHNVRPNSRSVRCFRWIS